MDIVVPTRIRATIYRSSLYDLTLAISPVTRVQKDVPREILSPLLNLLLLTRLLYGIWGAGTDSLVVETPSKRCVEGWSEAM